MIGARELRAELQSRWIRHPDSSHGEDYVNRGIQTALAAVNKLAEDVDPYAACKPAGDWCATHHAWQGGHLRWCGLAAAPWLHEQAVPA